MLFCEGCGAPLDAPWADLVIVCPSCGSHNLPGRPDGYVAPRAPADDRPRLNVGGRTYVLEGRIANGESTTVFRARWVVRLGELVVIKVLAAMSDGDLLRREWRTLEALHGSTLAGAEHYRTRLPTPVAHGLVDSDRPRPTSVFGWKSGFVHTLEDVGETYPQGVPGEAQVWILKRLLELLGCVHRAGFVHGAVVPAHVLIHPRDHGAILVGWTVATPWQAGSTQPLPAIPGRWSALYGGKREATPALDIAMACACAEAAGGWHLPKILGKAPIKRVIDKGRSGRVEDAWALRDELIAASAEAFGPSAYHPLTLPGWGSKRTHGVR